MDDPNFRLLPPARPLRIGDLAPDFVARTTQGEVKLSNFQRRWLLFFSHPADFTPVCTTEFVGIARAAERFAALDCALLGLSVDSLFAHLAWVRAIQEVHGVAIPFPVVEDPSMAIARAYGMVDESSPDSATVRASYVIDPRGVIRAISWYPHNVGRSVEEMLRLVAALRATETEAALAPEGWQPGAPMLALPPTVTGELADGADWFCRPAGAP
ncbi:MAG: peroxiredoxin [Rhodospirillales bacterium]|nr:peroxiredoxin [Rhodospirillales bacterium]